MRKSFYEIFNNKKPIIGMIHLAGKNVQEKMNRALEEIAIFEEEGIAGALIEDYHGSINDVFNTLKAVSKKETNLIIGINILRKPYLGFQIANEFGAKFIQFDSVQTKDLNLNLYGGMRERYPNIVVFGGIRFKYTSPTGNTLEQDLYEGKSRCDAIVTTGEGTGIETPIQKLLDFKNILGDYPLISGAGINKENIKEQLDVVDGVIVGSYLKHYNTKQKTDRMCVRELVQEMKS